MSDTLLIRADASTRIGTGHIMRCLALAQAWRRSGGSVLFASAEITPALEARLTAEDFQTMRLSAIPGTREDALETGEISQRENASWIVADSYNFGTDYQRSIKSAGLRLLFLDDYGHAGEYVADFVLNQNLAADPALYSRRTPETRLLLGPRYALLREEFLRWREWKREIPAVARKVLVTLGGADPDNVTGKVLQSLTTFVDLETVVVVGGSNPQLEKLKSEIPNSNSKISLVVDATNLPELMAWADVAVAAAGSTVWELAFMGLPSLVFTLADNQALISAALELEGVSVALGRANQQAVQSLATQLHAILSEGSRRSQMSALGNRLVDGRGGARMAKLLTDEK